MTDKMQKYIEIAQRDDWTIEEQAAAAGITKNRWNTVRAGLIETGLIEPRKLVGRAQATLPASTKVSTTGARVPLAACRHLDAAPGDLIDFEVGEPGVVILTKRVEP